MLIRTMYLEVFLRLLGQIISQTVPDIKESRHILAVLECA